MKIHSLLLIFAVAFSVQAQHRPDWENPRVFERNQQPPHTPLMPFSNRQKALELDFAGSEYFMPLDGSWKFLWSENPVKAPRRFYETDYDVSHWSRIQVPGNWQMQGFGHPLFRNIAHPFPANPPFVPKDYNPVGSYRRTFRLPSGWDNRRIFLHFEGVKSASTVWINGDSVGYNEGGMEPAEYDITPYVRPGVNHIAVQVIRWSDGSYFEDQDMWRLSGIYRSLYLMAIPNVHIRDFAVSTRFDSLYENALFSCTSWVKNYSTKSRHCSLKLDIYDRHGELVLSAPLRTEPLELAGGEENRVQLSRRIDRPAPWSAEDPALYTMILELVDTKGNTHEFLSRRFGFRQVEIRNRVLMINGKAVKLNGVNSHMHHPLTGRTVDRRTMKKDLILMKQFNINCVRTSHYPPDVAYLDLADELGMYIIDETGNEAHATPWLSAQPEWQQACIDRARKMIHRDRNHPSVIIWSAGNESGSGENICALIEEGKRIDPDRPWLYGGNDDWIPKKKPLPCEDIIGPRYPTPIELELHIARESPQQDVRPSFPDEYAAATGNSLGALDEFWHVIRSYPRIIGGAIWDWVSPAIQSDWVTVSDHSPFVNDGVLMGKARLVPGKSGKALALSGHDDWLELYRHPALDIDGNALTIDLRLFPRTWNGNGTLITKGSNQFGIQQISVDSLEFYVYTSKRTSVKTAVPPLWYYHWHHITAVYDGDRLVLYIDGNNVGQTSCTGTILNTPFPVNIGRNAQIHGQEHPGSLSNALYDQVRIFALALNPESLQQADDSLVSRSILWLNFDKAKNMGSFFSTGIGGRTYGLVWPDRRVQPELWQVKKSAQPITVEPLDLVAGRVKMINHYAFSSLERFLTKWQITANGHVVQQGEEIFTISPGQEIVRFGYKLPKSRQGVEHHLLITFALQDSTAWAPAGHVVAFEQFLLPELDKAEQKTHLKLTGELKVRENSEFVQVDGDSLRVIFNRPTGRLFSLNFHGNEYLRRGPQLNLWRAPLANELDPWALNKAGMHDFHDAMGEWVAGSWWTNGLHHLNQELVEFRVEKNKRGSVRVAVNSVYSSNQYTTSFEEWLQYTILQTGDIIISHHLVPHGVMPAWIPRIGMSMQLDSVFSNLRWFGRGPWETYPDRKSGAAVGLYSSTVRGDYVPYLLPQDYGNKTDVRWIALSNNRGEGIFISAEQLFNCSVHQFGLENLTRSLYRPQLKPADFVSLYIDHAVSGVGGTANSVMQKYRVVPQEVRYRVRLRPFRGGEEIEALYREFDWRHVGEKIYQR